MGLGNKLIIASGITLLSNVVTTKEKRENERRRQSPLSFDPRLTQHDFHSIVRDLAARTTRVKGATINGLVVSLDVSPISRLGSWTAEIDFNDYGHLTGRYWLVTATPDSAIPKNFAGMVGQEIARRTSNPTPIAPMRTRAIGPQASVAPPPPLVPQAAWYPDPYNAARLRYWDGRVWTGHTSH